MAPITPEQLAKAGTEHAHQVALMQWCAMNKHIYPELDLLFAIPNGGERNPIVASRLKAEGVKAGVPDLCLPVARHDRHGLFVEMKKPATMKSRSGTVSEVQGDWITALDAQKYAVAVCYGWEEARDCLIRYLS